MRRFLIDKLPHSVQIPNAFTTERIHGSRLSPDDTPEIHAALIESVMELTANCDWAAGITRKRFGERFVRQLLKQNSSGRRIDYVIRESNTCRLIGMVAFFEIDWFARHFEIGFWRRTSFRGQRYIIEATQLLIPLIQSNLGATQFLLHCDDKTQHMVKIAEQLGFHLQGEIINDIDARGNLRRLLVFVRPAIHT